MTKINPYLKIGVKHGREEKYIRKRKGDKKSDKKYTWYFKSWPHEIFGYEQMALKQVLLTQMEKRRYFRNL